MRDTLPSGWPVTERSSADNNPPVDGTITQTMDERASQACPSPTSLDALPAPAYTPSTLETSLEDPDLKLDGAQPTPSVGQCIVHLKLMEAFARLREEVGAADGLFGISDGLAELGQFWSADEASRAHTRAQIRERRWAVYVARAANRFEHWWRAALPNIPNGKPSDKPRQAYFAFDSPYRLMPLSFHPVQFTRAVLPPLDVLMVWHAYMLNPRDYLEDCVRYGMMQRWATGMPWAAVNDCIDNASLRYEPGEPARLFFGATTGLAWDNVDDLLEKVLTCPACPTTRIKCPWTTCVLRPNGDLPPAPSPPSYADGQSPTALAAFFASGTGFADLGFRQRCPTCDTIIDHETLRVQKFRKDLANLLLYDHPMPGTILSPLDGIPKKVSRRVPVKKHNTFCPNRLLLAGLKTPILEMTKPSKAGNKTTVNDIKKVFQDGIERWRLVGRAHKKARYKGLPWVEKVSLRKMMSRYWESSSPFALDLVGAVIRQGAFVHKMHKFDWLHSPTLVATMQRLLLKYDRFFSIMKHHPRHIAVPTLDVDLAWHTHQLSPRTYYEYSVQRTKKFIDHNDKIDENKLSDAFEWTSKQYEKMFKEVYSECTCWYCEAIRESHRSGLSRAFGSARVAETRFQECGAQDCDPERAVHISAHNSVRVPDTLFPGITKRAVLAREYDRACARAEKEGRPRPSRPQDSPVGLVWGLQLPHNYSYAPYMGEPCTRESYAVNPACMNLGTGVPGNCIAGACGGTAAAGVCAGSAEAGACAGGSGPSSACGGGACGGCGGGGCGGG